MGEVTHMENVRNGRFDCQEAGAEKMTFVSYQFALFLPAVAALFYVCPKRWRMGSSARQRAVA